MNNITVKESRRRLLLLLMFTLTVFLLGGCGEEQSIKDTPVVTPTKVQNQGPPALITSTPTPVPSPVPTTPTPTPVPIVYGDLTQYLNQSVAELTEKFGPSYQTELTNYDTLTQTSSRISFTPEVQFCFEQGRKPISSLQTAKVIRVENNSGATVDSDLGCGLRMNMGYSEIREKAGGVVTFSAHEENRSFLLYALVRGYLYCFSWRADPTVSGKPADFALISKSGMNQVNLDLISPYIEEYYEAHTKELNNHSSRYLSELRSACKDAPVSRYELLYDEPAGADTSVRIYEYAAYGHPAAYEKRTADGNETYVVSGIDKKTEIYQYCLVGCVFVDGECVRTYTSVYEQSDNLGQTGADARMISGLEWASEKRMIKESLGTMVGIPVEPSDDVLSVVSVRKIFTDKKDSYEVTIKAFYKNNETKPMLIQDTTDLLARDGGVINEHLYAASGSKDILEDTKVIKSGKGAYDGNSAEWELSEASPDAKIVKVATGSPDGEYREYLYYYADNSLILYRIDIR